MKFRLALWWRAIRPFAYPASIIPAFLGIALAWAGGYEINHYFAIITIIGAVAVHTASNLLSDYFDFKKGIDRSGTYGGSGVLVENLLQPRDILFASLLFYFISACVALFLIYFVGIKLIWIILVGLIAGVFYSMPPFGFKYGAIGELVVMIAFGVGITLGSYFVQTGQYSMIPVWHSIPFGLLVAAILNANNLRDLEDDVEVDVKTLAVMVGLNRARFVYGGFVFMAYALVIFFVAHGEMLTGSLACLLSLPLAANLVFNVWKAPYVSKEELNISVERTAQLSLAFGITMILGIAIWERMIL